ncbi:MAG TPA: transposase [Pyrinomonadaceae bacterium]|nr:transposase [Pyrinomonadaceae bacterium]
MTQPHALDKFGWHSRGYLPHFDGGSIPQSITIRLFDSLPDILLDRWSYELSFNRPEQREAELRRRIEAHLDMGIGSCWLADAQIAKLVQNALLHFDNQRYKLSCWTIMPNHVHLIATPLPPFSLTRIMHSLKSFTANEANKVLCRRGTFWMPDYFDRYIRNQKHFDAAVAYIKNNPVKAGLCKHAADWEFGSAWFRAQSET